MKNLIIIVSAACLLFISACKRDEYYIDGGKAVAEYPGNMLKYLKDKTVPFDTIAQIVKLANMEQEFSNEDFTFFAPDDDVIKRTIGTIRTDGLNRALYNAGRDTVKTLDQIDPLIWKKYLQRYMFKGVNKLKDYPQIDFSVKSVYPGGLYYAYSNNALNIGVVFNDANGIKYIGYRQLVISYIPDISKPNDNWFSTLVASSDIKPTNGVVHALRFNSAYFGFDKNEFFNEVYNTGLKNPSN
ncbi:hypothetical protein [Pedobacter sp.]|uniref:hypothetical protein n=1 Tax=Pedobacter sp. TaxID=1411316 RepID=UPI003BA9E321